MISLVLLLIKTKEHKTKKDELGSAAGGIFQIIHIFTPNREDISLDYALELLKGDFNSQFHAV